MSEKKKYNILKAISWYAIGNIFVKSISFFVLPYLSKVLSTEDNGVYTLFTSYAAIFDSIIIFGLSSTIRIAKYDKETDYDEYVQSVLMIPFFITGALFIGINIIFLFNTSFLSLNRDVWNLLFTYCLSNVLCLILTSKMNIDGKYKAYFVYLLINTVVGLAVFFILAKTLFVVERVYMARIVGQIMANVCCLAYLFSKVQIHKPKVSCIINGLKWGAPLIIHTFSITLFGQMDTILIKAVSDFSDVGIYGMATTLSLIPGTLQATLENAWNPWFFEKMDNKKVKEITDFNNSYLIVYATLLIMFMLIVPDAIHFLDSSYWTCIYFLLPLTINFFIEFLYLIPLNIQYFYKNTKNLMLSTIIATIIDVVMVFVFIKLFGFYGAVYAKTLAKVILVLLHKKAANKLDSNNYVSIKTSSICLMALFVIDFLVIIYVNNTIIRLLMFFAIGIILLLYIFRKKDLLMKIVNGD